MNPVVRALLQFVFITAVLICGRFATAATTPSRVVDGTIHSSKFRGSKIGTDPERRIAVYLPPGYNESSQRYPVIYFVPTTNYRNLFDRDDAKSLFDRALLRGTIGNFILVVVDMNTVLGSSWCVNSPATGNWEDFATQEVPSYVDAHFRTLAHAESRGIAGEFMGGYCALRLGMEHPEVWSSVYGLHPVGTGSGLKVMLSLPNWDVLAHAKSLDDVKVDGYSAIFTTIFQAHLPNPDKPPLFIDLAAHKEGSDLEIDSQLSQRVRANFFLESLVPQYADNMKSLRGLKFDWGRGDLNQDHVYSNQALTHKLNEFGIPHEAEEYNGGGGDHNWGEEGRVYNEVLPFFRKHLVFESAPAQ